MNIKKIIRWSIPLYSVEILLFLIFYEFFAYLFLIFGILFTFIITSAIVKVIQDNIEKEEENKGGHE